MSVNDYIAVATGITGPAPTSLPNADYTAQVSIGLDFAKRQAEKTPVEVGKIPSLGAVPLAN